MLTDSFTHVHKYLIWCLNDVYTTFNQFIWFYHLFIFRFIFSNEFCFSQVIEIQPCCSALLPSTYCQAEIPHASMPEKSHLTAACGYSNPPLNSYETTGFSSIPYIKLQTLYKRLQEIHMLKFRLCKNLSNHINHMKSGMEMQVINRGHTQTKGAFSSVLRQRAWRSPFGSVF